MKHFGALLSLCFKKMRQNERTKSNYLRDCRFAIRETTKLRSSKKEEKQMREEIGLIEKTETFSLKVSKDCLLDRGRERPAYAKSN